MSYTLFIRNMVGSNCKKVVTQLIKELYGHEPISIRLGEVILKDEISSEVVEKIKESLNAKGYNLILDGKAEITVQVKQLLEIVLIGDTLDLKLKISEYLAENMRYEYHYLSSLFSQMEGTTIEQYFIKLRVEKIKELIAEGKLSLSQISYKFGYSSPAHLSNQFKKITGLAPTNYKKLIQKKQ